MRKAPSLLLLLTLLFALTVACDGREPACNDEIGCIEIAPDEPIQIAYMLTLSGDTAFLGIDALGGIELALDDANRQLRGHPIELVGKDSKCTLDGGQAAAEELVSNPSLVAIIGTSCSDAAMAALPYVSDAGLVMMSPSNTAVALTDPVRAWKPGYFRTAHNDLFQGRMAAEFVYNELGAREIATIHDGSSYADQLQDAFADTFRNLGGSVAFQGSIQVGDTDMTEVLSQVAAASPDLLYFPIYEPEGNYIVQQAPEVPGMEDVVLMGADGLLGDTFPQSIGSRAVGVYLSGPYFTGSEYEIFVDKWINRYGDDPPGGFHAYAYDGTQIVLNAIARVAQEDEDGSLLIGRQALRDALAATAEFNGLTGLLSCSETGDCATGDALGIYKITAAEVEGNWPPPVAWTP